MDTNNSDMTDEQSFSEEHAMIGAVVTSNGRGGSDRDVAQGTNAPGDHIPWRLFRRWSFLFPALLLCLLRPGIAQTDHAIVHAILRPQLTTPAGLGKSMTTPVHASEGRAEGIFLPAGDIFSPILADPKEPRMYVNYRHARFYSTPVASGGRTKFNAVLSGIGSDIGLWRWWDPQAYTNIQLSVFTAVFSQFNLDSKSFDLINSDFLVGFPVTFRKSELSARLRVFHQSSHLGDEFLLNNPKVDRENLSFEAIDFIGSVEDRWWRLYGGGGYAFHREPSIAPGWIHGGGEFRGPQWSRTELYFATDLQAYQEQAWRLTVNLAMGVVFTSRQSGRQIRVMLVYLNGFLPFGQFFNKSRVANGGIGLSFNL